MKGLSLIFAMLISTGISIAQTDSDFLPCGTSEAVKKSLEENPGLQLEADQLERFTKEYSLMNQDKLLDSVYTIPVVFHVFHTYGSERISEAQIRDCIRIINEDFQNRNPDSNTVSSRFKNLVGRPQLRFRLAQKDPSGRCTKGINYIESALHTQGGENLKSIISWDTRRYLNIWVCSVVASGAAAYAYYPGSAPSQNAEGIVSRSDYVGTIGSSSGGYRARTMTHEIGHYFNLAHTWGNSNTPGLASNCNIDDGVTDTPVCRGVTGTSCNLNQVSCSDTDNVENHMEYSNCRKMFTKGQVLRMHAAVRSTAGFRSNLWKGPNLVLTGSTNDSQGDECPAKVDFKSNLTRVCAGQSVNFTQLAYNVNDPAGLVFNWSFPGGTPSSSSAPNPIVMYDSAGSFNVKLVVTNLAGKDSLVKSNSIKVLPTATAYQAGEVESFETITFPNFPSNSNKNWDVSSTVNSTWRRSTSAFVSGGASLAITNSVNSRGAVHTLISPVFEVAGPTTGAKIAMKYAFARRNTTNADKLIISYSTNCGKTWSQTMNRTGATLATVSTPVAISFVPSASQWKQENLSLPFLGSSSQFRLRFEFTSDGGNNLFIDDIQLTTITAVNNLQDDNLSLTIVPNPSLDLPKIRIDRPEGGKAIMEITDVLGKKQILNKEIQLVAESTELDLNREIQKPSPGTYWVRLVLENRVMVRQWVVLP
jgi:PKD repeat protein